MQATLYYSEEDLYLLRLVDERARRERKSRSAVIMAILEEYFEHGKKLGEILVDMGVVAQSQVEEALREQAADESKRRIGEILVERQAVTTAQVEQALVVQERVRSAARK